MQGAKDARLDEEQAQQVRAELEKRGIVVVTTEELLSGPEAAEDLPTSTSESDDNLTGPQQMTPVEADTPTLLIGVQAHSLNTLRAIQERVKGVDISSVTSLSVDPIASQRTMQDALAHRYADMGVILDTGAKDIDTILSQISPFIISLGGTIIDTQKADEETLISLSEAISKAIKAVRENRGDDYIIGIVREANLRRTQLLYFISVIEETLLPISAIDWDNLTIEGVTVTPSSLFSEAPQRIRDHANKLAANRDDNILVITDAQVTSKNKIEYLEMLKKILSEIGIDFSSLYKHENVITLDELGEDLTKTNALARTRERIRDLKDDESIDPVYLGGNDYYEDTIDIALIIKGVFDGDRESIARALKMLGDRAKGMKAEDLVGRVIDLRSHTKDISDCKRAIREIGRAL